MNHQVFSKEVLKINPEKAVSDICFRLRSILSQELKRRGLVVAISGGIDSSVTAALAVQAVGAERVLALQMPERHSADETLQISGSLAKSLRVGTVHEDITDILDSVGFYRRYDDAIRSVIPDYGSGWKSKIVISNVVEAKTINYFSVVAQPPGDKAGSEQIKKRLPLKAYLEIVAATNFKQRIRKMLEYYHADRLNYAVAGTPNRLEYDQGFFVKLGDGAADVKPIAHLYKTQVYQLAEYLGIPEEIRKRPPTTDTYSLSQGQDEFYFSLPYDKMDLCLYGKNNAVAIQKVATAVGLSVDQLQRVYDDIDTKRATTRYLHMPAVLMASVPEISEF